MGCDIEKTRQIRLCPKKKETLAVYQDTSLTREQNAETSLEEDGNKQKSYCNTLFLKSTFSPKNLLDRFKFLRENWKKS